MPPTRNPFPYPPYENDNTFRGREMQRATYRNPPHLEQQEDPWNRLNATPTLSSARRTVYYTDPEAPSDSLDFHLKSLYDHHNSLLKDRNETLFQMETLTDSHGRILKNRVKETPPPQEEKSNIRQWVSPQRISVYSIDGAIVSQHTAATNRGYSRKQDGGYYSI
ncbi:cilia- and flagella-associated protein 276 [Spea bombifrons]|uniref:cilia- and flagella-associated protein 276 n=1 Tax=Spea bombifrons TaxID=233779 RepID=UPI00234BC97E|nr:cilia- and flagella-associated protein 276 [Spea bombifrons]